MNHPSSPADRHTPAEHPAPVTIELFALDTERCSPCRAALANVEEAALQIGRSLDPARHAVSTRVVRLGSPAEARRLGVVSSPTVRVNGRDIALGVDEQDCPSCGDLAGTAVSCRTFSWRGAQYDHPPVGLIVEAVKRHLESEAVLSAACCDGHACTAAPAAVPTGATSIDRFFEARAHHD